MAQPERSIFNEKAASKLRSPDDLDKYVRVTNPSMWAILVACIALLAGLFSWAFFGSVSASVGATGVLSFIMSTISLRRIPRFNLTDINR